MLEERVKLSEEVRTALADGRPVVALESTIITHGMPHPVNLETALAVEQTVRDHGAVPATIAILDGDIRVGLSTEELTQLAQLGDVIKVSRRDLPYVVATRRNGATTVAATMICAHWAGIQVFATGGIGGVHRGATQTMDISADLEELARTNVAVVCAGAKAILDIGLTLEYLETRGVPVVGYRTSEFPAFYTRRSGYELDCTVETPEAAAELLRTKWELGLTGGVLIANPIPAEHALDEAVIEQAIQQALQDAEQRGITGKAVTPFLLDRVKELTGGASLAANVALVKNNAALAAEIAAALCNAGR
jgi:pseudouridine-5'-phosphate glycosidase